jgi:hypothetical protein
VLELGVTDLELLASGAASVLTCTTSVCVAVEGLRSDAFSAGFLTALTPFPPGRFPATDPAAGTSLFWADVASSAPTL